jgi:hypothetical protein
VPLTAHIIEGAVLSFTTTSKLQLTAFPAESAAVHVTVVVPLLNVILLSVVPEPLVAPDNAKVNDWMPQLSVAVASHDVPLWVYSQCKSALTFCVPLTAHIIEGAVFSFTCTSKMQLTAFPAESTAVHVTVVVPLLNVILLRVVPESFVAPDNAKVKAAMPQLSVAVASHDVPV